MLRDKLSRFSQHLDGPQNKPVEHDQYDRSRLIAEALGGEIIDGPAGTYVKITRNFDTTYRHGRMTLDNLPGEVDLRGDRFYRELPPTPIEASRLLFFDTETTGLGGTGTVPFLLGFGSITPGGFQVRQYFLPDYPDEAAMLEDARLEITAETVLVSYNGKSFDIPILTDRLILHRVERNLTFAGHLDLLHATRRLFRRRLQSCTLGNIERNVLEFIRVDDLPGELVPAVYFNWLATSETAQLDKVIEHNRHDIVSLYFLLYHINTTLARPGETLADADDLYSVARIYERRREHDRVRQLLDDCRHLADGNRRAPLLWLQSLACKRTGHLDRATAIWEELSGGNTPEAFAALIELAKYHEHRSRRYRLALEMAERARRIGSEGLARREDLAKRIGRLQSKIECRAASK